MSNENIEQIRELQDAILEKDLVVIKFQSEIDDLTGEMSDLFSKIDDIRSRRDELLSDLEREQQELQVMKDMLSALH